MAFFYVPQRKQKESFSNKTKIGVRLVPILSAQKDKWTSTTIFFPLNWDGLLEKLCKSFLNCGWPQHRLKQIGQLLNGWKGSFSLTHSTIAFKKKGRGWGWVCVCRVCVDVIIDNTEALQYSSCRCRRVAGDLGSLFCVYVVIRSPNTLILVTNVTVFWGFYWFLWTVPFTGWNYLQLTYLMTLEKRNCVHKFGFV